MSNMKKLLAEFEEKIQSIHARVSLKKCCRGLPTITEDMIHIEIIYGYPVAYLTDELDQFSAFHGNFWYEEEEAMS